jgi:hypothetical protein
LGAHPEALLVMDNVEILKERSPPWVLVPDRVRESNHGAVRFGDHRAGGVRSWVSKSARPRSQAIRLDVTVEESVCVRASVVTTPAINVERCNRRRIPCLGAPIPQDLRNGHDILLIDPGVGTALSPDAGPSQGQVPQVSLDERPDSTRSATTVATEYSSPVTITRGTRQIALSARR